MNQKYSDYLFETSWEICNKVGGIYTVLSTKAATVVGNYHDHYICIGPDIPKDYNDDLHEYWKAEAAAAKRHLKALAK